jgi:hypothetical protein
VSDQTPRRTRTQNNPSTEGEVATLEAAPEGQVAVEEQLAVEALIVGPNPTTDWRSWAAQQGGMVPTGVGTPPFPPATVDPRIANTVFPGINPITDKILGANSTPIYADVPTTIKPPDLYQGWTAQQPLTMAPNVFPPAAVLISRVVPNSLAASTAVAVTLQGLGFTGATGVNFGATAGTAFTVVNDTTITVTTPATLTAGTYAVTVLSPKGNNTLANAVSTH